MSAVELIRERRRVSSVIRTALEEIGAPWRVSIGPMDCTWDLRQGIEQSYYRITYVTDLRLLLIFHSGRTEIANPASVVRLDALATRADVRATETETGPQQALSVEITELVRDIMKKHPPNVGT